MTSNVTVDDPNGWARSASDNMDRLIRDPMQPLGAADALAITQTQATLAVAFEQRTANLIALYLEGPHTISVDRGALGEQIKERLGLS